VWSIPAISYTDGHSILDATRSKGGWGRLPGAALDPDFQHALLRSIKATTIQDAFGPSFVLCISSYPPYYLHSFNTLS
jgi:hypothetical protein